MVNGPFFYNYYKKKMFAHLNLNFKKKKEVKKKSRGKISHVAYDQFVSPQRFSLLKNKSYIITTLNGLSYLIFFYWRAFIIKIKYIMRTSKNLFFGTLTNKVFFLNILLRGAKKKVSFFLTPGDVNKTEISIIYSIVKILFL